MSRLTFLYQMDLPHRAVAVYTYLHDRADKNGECFPSVKTIADDIKLSPATVRRAIKDLKKAGLIETEQRYREQGGKSSLLYRIKNKTLEKYDGKNI
jgi:GntR family transcriptional regulator